MKLAVIFGLVVLVGGGWAFEKHSRAGNERALSAVATQLAGRQVHVHCESFWHSVVGVGGNLGDVPFPDGRAASYTHITRHMCDELARFRRQPDRRELSRDMEEALITLTHESMHMRGWADEAVAQCYAIQEVPFTVEQLGGSREEGAAVAAAALAMQPYMPTEYQSSDCAAGRSLDLHPETPAFPAEPDPRPLPAGFFGPQL
jgi:hypothetical protein